MPHLPQRSCGARPRLHKRAGVHAPPANMMRMQAAASGVVTPVCADLKYRAALLPSKSLPPICADLVLTRHCPPQPTACEQKSPTGPDHPAPRVRCTYETLGCASQTLAQVVSVHIVHA
eukprot:547393-Amphidinium_carterae.1